MRGNQTENYKSTGIRCDPSEAFFVIFSFLSTLSLLALIFAALAERRFPSRSSFSFRKQETNKTEKQETRKNTDNPSPPHNIEKQASIIVVTLPQQQRKQNWETHVQTDNTHTRQTLNETGNSPGIQKQEN